VRNNPKSPWDCRIPGHGDRGQRFVVYYKDGKGDERPFGYSQTQDGVDALVKSIEKHPIWYSPRVVDRQAGKGAK
jgi:hypothetical protein